MKQISLYGGDYSARSDGKIFSNKGKKKELVGKVTKEGYRMVIFSMNGKKTYKNVHRVIAETFIPNPLKLPQVNHIDGDKLNNATSNLKWVNSSENLIHARDNGLIDCKLDMKKANEIRELYKKGNHTQRQIAKIFNVSKTLVWDIINNRRWTE